ncbi:MAG: hypothetical protein ACFFDP_07695 [Promethearchaeota archaeon]
MSPVRVTKWNLLCPRSLPIFILQSSIRLVVMGYSMATDSPAPPPRLDPRHWRITCLYRDDESFDIEQD